MRKFSRWMPPPSRPRMGYLCRLLQFGCAAAGLAVVITYPCQVTFAIGFIVVVSAVLQVIADRRLRRLAAGRVGEDIGSFARALDRRREPFDPWVVRATWDELYPCAPFWGGRLPVRPNGRLYDVLGIDPEELEFLAIDVAWRAGRLLEDCRSNRYTGRIETVGDLIEFLSGQPKDAVGA